MPKDHGGSFWRVRAANAIEIERRFGRARHDDLSHSPKAAFQPNGGCQHVDLAKLQVCYMYKL